MAEQTNNYDLVLERAIATTHLDCQLNLQQIAQRWSNVEYRDDVVIVQLRTPDVRAHLWSNGQMSCCSTIGEEQARTGVRRIARMLQKQGFGVTLRRLRIHVLARCTVPFRIRVAGFALYHKMAYEPELRDSVEYEIRELQASISVYCTGIIEIAAPTMVDARKAADQIYPRLKEFCSLPRAAPDQQAHP